jgi:hypothetical protein
MKFATGMRIVRDSEEKRETLTNKNRRDGPLLFVLKDQINREPMSQQLRL